MEPGHSAADRFLRGLEEMPDGGYDNAFKVSGKRSCATSQVKGRSAGGCWKAPKGVQLAELGLKSCAPEKMAGGAGDQAMKRDTILTIKLPRAGATKARSSDALEDSAVREPQDSTGNLSGPFARIAYAAAHVGRRPFLREGPLAGPAIDWDATIAYRRHLSSWGFGIAEAMDAAQRGMGLDSAGPPRADSPDFSKVCLGTIVASGAGTDHLSPGEKHSMEKNTEGLRRAMHGDRKAGRPHHPDGESRARPQPRIRRRLASVYDRILGQVKRPVIIHWLGGMFDPALEGYWGEEGPP